MLDDAERHQINIVTDDIASATEVQAAGLYRRMGGYADFSPFHGIAGETAALPVHWTHRCCS